MCEALRSGWITTGPRTKQLEKNLAEFCGVEYMACLNSATAAEELNLRILGIGAGDEILVPAYTYTASASAAFHVGATVKFIDSQPDCCEMDYDQMEAAITEKTKAISPVDLGGVACDELGILHLNHYEKETQSSGHLYIVRVPGINHEKRCGIITKMAERGIACNVHYKPLPMMTAYKSLGFDIKDYPNAYRYFENEITLPLHTKLSDEDVDYVIDNFKEVVRDVTAN